MITIDGFASANENPSVGPPVYSMVRFGAKESALIIKHGEWWRIISPTMLHAGIIHIVPNVAIQVRIFNLSISLHSFGFTSFFCIG